MVFSCKGKQSLTKDEMTDSVATAGPVFMEDSAYEYCAKQCAFGPRIMNSVAHDNCGKWIVDKFRSFGLDVIEQKAELRGYDDTPLNATNIIAQYKPEAERRVIVCAHWDARPWADNDPDEKNHKTPIDAANDGASGVGVMLEIARLLQTDTLSYGVDFICFDAEDWGLPTWATWFDGVSEGTWSLGSQYWGNHLHKEGYKAEYGILLDMVGGIGAQFLLEQGSTEYAPEPQKLVWEAARTAGYSGFFPMEKGGSVIDDHLSVCAYAGIPCVDVIPCFWDGYRSSFGPTWHTVNDNMQNLSKETLKAVGQTIVQVLYQ